jgi:hypothetical protein
MRKCEVFISPTVDIEITDTDTKSFQMLEDCDRYSAIAISHINKEGRLIYMMFMTSSAKSMLQPLSNDELFNTEIFDVIIKGAIWDTNTQKHIYEEVATFEGTLYDVLLVVANKGAKYDRG